jgi:hypothetical protein
MRLAHRLGWPLLSPAGLVDRDQDVVAETPGIGVVGRPVVAAAHRAQDSPRPGSGEMLARNGCKCLDHRWRAHVGGVPQFLGEPAPRPPNVVRLLGEHDLVQQFVALGETSIFISRVFVRLCERSSNATPGFDQADFAGRLQALPSGKAATDPRLRGRRARCYAPRLRPSHGSARRRGGRAVEGARLESVYAGNRIAGSNPAPSATRFA